jgi:hypothetical protein
MPGALVADTRAPQTALKNANVGMTLSTDQPAPGDVVTVMLDGPHGDARITMTDDAGTSVEQGDIPSTQNAVTLTVPSVTKPATYYVMASISQGVGEQTVVRKLTVTPR